MLNLVLADSELETIPKELWNHPLIVKFSKKKKKHPCNIILDSNYHHRAMKNLEDSYRRGRPDIVHVCLLYALDSLLNKRGELKVFVHTRNNFVFVIKPETRIPRSYNRFIGLFEKVFEEKETEFIYLKRMSLKDFLEGFGEGAMVMHQDGEKFFPKKNATVVVGGFPHGDFLEDLPYKKYSLSRERLSAWTVVSEVLVRWHLNEEL